MGHREHEGPSSWWNSDFKRGREREREGERGQEKEREREKVCERERKRERDTHRPTSGGPPGPYGPKFVIEFRFRVERDGTEEGETVYRLDVSLFVWGEIFFVFFFVSKK